jgi:hypothetical protein
MLEEYEQSAIKTCRICLQSDQDDVVYSTGKGPMGDTEVKESDDLMRLTFKAIKAFGPSDNSRDKGFVSPCKCTGSMRWVHKRCLLEWRIKSTRNDSFSNCEQCRAPYLFRRSIIAGLLSNRLFVRIVSMLLIMCGFVIASVVSSFIFDRVTRIQSLYIPKYDSWRMQLMNRHVGYQVGMCNNLTCATDTNGILSEPTISSNTPVEWLKRKHHILIEIEEQGKFGTENRFLIVLPLAIALIATAAIMVDGSNGAIFIAGVIIVATAELYNRGSLWAVWIYPAPAAYGLGRYITQIRRNVRRFMQGLYRRVPLTHIEYPK